MVIRCIHMVYTFVHAIYFFILFRNENINICVSQDVQLSLIIAVRVTHALQGYYSIFSTFSSTPGPRYTRYTRYTLLNKPLISY